MRYAVLIGLLALGCDRGSEDHPWAHLYGAPRGRFVQVSSVDTTGGNRDRLEIAPGDSAVILDVEGPGRIERLWMTVASSDPHYLRRIVIRVFWDGEADPSVNVPLGDLFGNAFDRRHYASQLMGVSSGGFYSYWPMPFRRRATIVVANETGRNIDALYYNIGLRQDVRLPRTVATFHARWHRNHRTTDPVAHEVLAVSGRGHYVGTVLNAEAYLSRLWFLEGDEGFEVDGAFRGQGTGTEDYFNGGWYFEAGEFSAPYHGLVVKDAERGRIAAYRWHLTDPIPFERSFRMTLEHGPGNEEVADFATTAFWYQEEPHEAGPPLPRPEQRRVLGVKIPPGATLSADLRVERQERARFTAVAPWPDRYDVILYPSGGPGAAVWSYQLAGSGQGPVRVDLNAAEPETVLPPVVLGRIRVDSVAHVESDGSAPLPAAVVLRPVPAWAAEWSVVGPFPNPQRLGTEYSPGLDSSYGPETASELARVYDGGSRGLLRWRPVNIDDDGQVRLRRWLADHDWVLVYAQSFLFSPEDREATLLFGADDAHVLWVNGERVSERQGRHLSQPDDLMAQVRLRAGWNEVLLKVANLDGGWAFQVRVANPDGRLRWSRQPR